MKIAAICCTYLRPNLLDEAVNSFLAQDYPNKEMIILDDAGQYAPTAADHLPGVRLVTTRHRFRTLGEKRNATAALVSADVDAYCVWDDDDIYLPWHMTAAAAALAEAAYVVPSTIYLDKKSHLVRKQTGGLFHPAWSFRRELFDQICGYPFMQSGQDQGLLRRFKATDAARADACQHEPRPSFVYRWCTAGSKHLSSMGAGGYEKLEQHSPPQHVARIQPRWQKDWSGLAAAELGAYPPA